MRPQRGRRAAGLFEGGAGGAHPRGARPAKAPGGGQPPKPRRPPPPGRCPPLLRRAVRWTAGGPGHIPSVRLRSARALPRASRDIAHTLRCGSLPERARRRCSATPRPSRLRGAPVSGRGAPSAGTSGAAGVPPARRVGHPGERPATAALKDAPPPAALAGAERPGAVLLNRVDDQDSNGAGLVASASRQVLRGKICQDFEPFARLNAWFSEV